MASNVTRDHHNLRRNLKLNGNYISNDGGDEGISINDAGQVRVGTQGITDGSTAQLYAYRDVTETAAANYWGQKVDIERSGNQTTGSAYVSGLRFNATSTASTGGTTNMLGIYGDVTGQLAEDSGNMYVKGIRLDVQGHANGNSVSTGMELNVEGGTLNYGLYINCEDGGRDLRIVSSADTGDYFQISTGASGATTIATVDDAGADDAHLTLDVDGNIILDADAGYTYIDNDGTRHGYLSAFSSTKLILGATTNYDLKLATSGTGDIIIDSSGHVEFDGCAVGFDKLAGAFGTSQVLDDPNDSTDIDFRLSNKYELELTNIIAGAASSEFLNLIFPAVSGNFILVISQDGTGGRTIHPSAWVAYQSDGSTKATNVAFANGTDGAIRWAGGSATPITTTADKADIVSIYWDADNETAFAVVSQNF
jgi:hypothetical protein